MKYKLFTPEEKEILKEPLSDVEIANKLGRSFNSVRAKRVRLGIEGRRQAAPLHQDSSVADDLKVKDENYWTRAHGELSRKYQKLLREQNAVERLVRQVAALAPLSYSATPAIIRTAQKKHRGKGQSAVLMFSDTHIGKITTSD